MNKKSPKLEVEELQAKINELTLALQQERADSINLRRHFEARAAFASTAIKANVVRELLPAVDNLERSLTHVPKDLDGHHYVKGVQGVVKQFAKALSALGVERIKTVGEEFNPKHHEAVSMEPGEGEREVITEETQAGYKINDEVIRHAMVKVKLT